MALKLDGTGYLEYAGQIITTFPFTVLEYIAVDSSGNPTIIPFSLSASAADSYACSYVGAYTDSKVAIYRSNGNSLSATKNTAPHVQNTGSATLLPIVTVFTSAASRTVYFGNNTGSTDTGSGTNILSSLNRLQVGCLKFNGGAAQLFMKGHVAELHIFNGELSSTDIGTLVGAGGSALPNTLPNWLDGWMLKDYASDGNYVSMGGTRTLVATGGVTAGTLAHPVTRVSPPSATTQPSNQTAMVGATATFTSVWSGTPTGYQWQRSTDSGSTWNNVSGATSASYTTAATTLTGGTANNGDQFRVQATNTGGTTNSNAATLTVNPAQPTINTHPTNQTVTATNTATFSVSASASGGSLTYQWQKSQDSGSTWNNVTGGSGGTTNTFTTPATTVTGGTVNNGDRFRCQVTDSNATVNSNSATITVNAAATAVTMSGPTSGAVGAASSNFSIGVSGGALPANVTVTPSDAGNGGTFTPTSLTLTPGTPSGTFTYTPATGGSKTISVTNNGGLSNPSNITFTATAQPIINTQPTAATVTAPNTANFSVSATASAGGGSLTYQWQRSTDSGSTWNNVSTGTGGTTNAYTTAATTVTGGNANNNDRYRVQITDSNGTATSNGVILTVNPTPTGPNITGQPSNATIANGATATFTVTATANGGSLTYQWQRSTDSGSTWSSVSTGTGGTTNSYTTPTATLTGGNANNGDRYRCQVTDSFGTIATNSATLTVNATGPSITTQPQAQSVTTPATATFTAAATASSGSVTWQWQRSTDGGSTWTNISGATSASYTTPATAVTGGSANNGDRYRANATDTNGTTATSSAMLTVGAAVAGTVTLPQVVNDTMSKLESISGWSVWVRTTSMGYVADLTNQSTNSSGDMPLSSTSMVAGTSYVFVLYHATHGWGLQFATAA